MTFKLRKLVYRQLDDGRWIYYAFAPWLPWGYIINRSDIVKIETLQASQYGLVVSVCVGFGSLLSLGDKKYIAIITFTAIISAVYYLIRKRFLGHLKLVRCPHYGIMEFLILCSKELDYDELIKFTFGYFFLFMPLISFFGYKYFSDKELHNDIMLALSFYMLLFVIIYLSIFGMPLLFIRMWQDRKQGSDTDN